MGNRMSGRGLVLAVAGAIALVAAVAAAILLRGQDQGGLRGTVVGPTGAPISGAEVTSGNVAVRADGSGEFRLDAPAGWVTVRADGWLPRTRVVAPEGDVLFRLSEDAEGTVTFAFGGDVMFGRRYFDPDEDGVPDDGLLRPDAGPDDHLALLDGVRPALEDADLAVVNLETPLAEDPYPDPTAPRPSTFHPHKDFVFASRPAAAQALARAGVDVVDVANNHLFDRLAPGIASTRAALDAGGFRPGKGFFGAGADDDEAWAPALREVDGQTVGFVGCTSITGEEHEIDYVAAGERGDSGGAALCEPERLREEVRALRARADVVVAMIHGGFEYGREPSGQVRDLSDVAVEAGATMVVNHHPHVVGGLRFADGRLTAWTLGNLLFDQTVWPTFESYLLRVATRGGRVVSAWIEPLRIQGFRPFGVYGEDAEWVARGALDRSEGPWVLDEGSLWLDAKGAAQQGQEDVDDAGGLTRLRSGCAPRAGRDLLWTGDFEARDLEPGGDAPLWNVDDDLRDRRAVSGAAFHGDRGVRLRRSGADREDVLLSPLHRVLVTPGHELSLLISHRDASGHPAARLQLSWYNDTRGASQQRTVVDLPSGDWQTSRIDVRVPRNAIAVQPFIRLAPPELSLAALDVDDVRLVDWDEPGCGYVRGAATVTRRSLAPLRPEPEIERIEARTLPATAPAALPLGPPDVRE